LDFDTQTDKELAALAAAGNEGAFTELLKRYERPIFSLIYRMVRDRALAEDLAQGAFIRAFNARSSYDPRYEFSSWVFKIANNHTIDHLRCRKLDTVSIDGSPHARTAQEEEQTRLVVEDTFFTSLDSEGLVKRGDTYESLDYDDVEYQIAVDVDAAFGGVRVTWIN
jgi:RNA polymerase sigma-70 factor (ECF subfamily)